MSWRRCLITRGFIWLNYSTCQNIIFSLKCLLLWFMSINHTHTIQGSATGTGPYYDKLSTTETISKDMDTCTTRICSGFCFTENILPYWTCITTPFWCILSLQWIIWGVLNQTMYCIYHIDVARIYYRLTFICDYICASNKTHTFWFCVLVGYCFRKSNIFPRVMLFSNVK